MDFEKEEKLAKEKTWREAIEEVLKIAGTSMHYKEIADQIISRGFRENVGATPAATVNVTLVNTINNLGDKSPFLKVRKGEYILKNLYKTRTKKRQSLKEEDIEEKQYEIITSFGMFWQRNLIKWVLSPKILGVQQRGAEPVDFCNQQGIYLLYDIREIIYVGRATENLGRRLYEHTIDRLSTRWDRFSWFGLLPVSEKGTLENMPTTYKSEQLIPAIEAILVEALEPRQNRKRGDDLSSVEYIQKEDPEIKKKKLKEDFDELLRR
jgi:hypothetical protein